MEWCQIPRSDSGIVCCEFDSKCGYTQCQLQQVTVFRNHVKVGDKTVVRA